MRGFPFNSFGRFLIAPQRPAGRPAPPLNAKLRHAALKRPLFARQAAMLKRRRQTI